MKILMILPQGFFEPKGTSFSTLNRLKVLSKLGHKVDLLTYPIGDDVVVKDVKIFRIPKMPFIKQVRIGPSVTKLFLDIILIAYSIKMLMTKRYDLIHSHEEAGFFSTFLAKIFGIPHVYDMHSSLPQQLLNFEFTRSRIIIGIFTLLEKLTIDHADRIITICPALHERVNKLAPRAKEYLIENVVDNMDFVRDSKESIETLRQKYNLNNKRIILYAGTFEAYQGLDLLIEGAEEVISRFNDVHFLLIGGRPNQILKYRGQVQQRGLSNYFTFTGSLSPEEVNSFYPLADILVSPRKEGTNTPLKIYTYLRSGKPIVATRHITHTQVLNDKVAVLTDLTPQAFAQGIIRLLEDRKLRIRLSKEAIKLAEERYSYNYYFSQMKDLFNGLERKQN